MPKDDTTKYPRLGAHVSIAGGIYKAPQNGVDATCDVIQIFTKSSSQWNARPLSDEDIEKFRKAREETGVDVVCAHDSYLINLASHVPPLQEKSHEAFSIELTRCERLGIPHLVMHPGSYTDSTEKKALRRLIDAFNRILEENSDGNVTICLENTAGQGTNLGYKFEHLAEIIDGVEDKNRFGVCLDTCHMFAAGYRFKTRKSYESTMKEFDDIIGLHRLKIIHMNDSKREIGSRVDRHEHIGRGEIGARPFGYFLNDPRLKKIPMIIETPKQASVEDDRANLKLLRSMIKSQEKGKK